MRRLLPLAAAILALGIAVPALATPPAVTLTSPSGHSDANPPAITGTAGHAIGDGHTVTVELFNGEAANGEPLMTLIASVHEGDGSFSVTPEGKLADGTYTARARQTTGEQETGTSNLLTFTIGAVATPTPTPTPTATATPVTQAAIPAATPTPVAAHVCASRRDFTKHVHRPKGTHIKVAATLNGQPWKSVIAAKQILVRLDLRGLPKDTYTLRVAVTYTRPDGKRVTTRSVERIDYHTCMPKPG